PQTRRTTMKLFAGNTIVQGDTIFAGEQDPTGRPNPPSAAAMFEEEVLALRSKIQSTPFGARWLDIVGTNKEPIYIVPSTDTTNAVTQTLPNDTARPTRTLDGKARGFDGVGTGRGTPMRIQFNRSASVGPFYASASGAVLLVHEMTHAYRGASGRFSPFPMVGLVDAQRLQANARLALRFPTWEEWLAVVVENVFASEQGATTLRLNWDEAHPATARRPRPPPPCTGPPALWGGPPSGPPASENVAADDAPAIARMQQVEGPLFQAMLTAPASWFNPVADRAPANFRRGLQRRV